MKKFLSLALAAAMMLSLAACGGSASTASTDTTSTAGAASTATSEAAEVATGSAAPDWAPYDELINQIYSETDFTKREALLHQAEDMLMSTYAVVPLYYYNDIYMQRSTVSGVYSTVYGMKFFQSATVDGGDTLRLCLASEPDYLDPALNSSVDGATLALNSFVGLYTYDDNNNPIPALADGEPTVNEDGTEYVFTLKPDLKWSDGSALTANDFVYSWNRAIADETAADYAYMFDIVARKDDGSLDVTASEDGTQLTVVLTGPCAYFLDLCAFPTYLPVPQAAVEADADPSAPGKWAQEAGFISNGPFVLTSWTHNESMVYEKNPNYYDADKVTLAKLEFMLSDDDTAIFAAYNSGDLDFIDTLPTDEISSLLSNDEFYIVDQLGTYFITFNVNADLFAGKTAEQAAAMREAISLLIDRDYIAENIGQTGQLPANAFVCPKMSDGHGGEFKTNDADYTYPDEANVGYYDPSFSDENVDAAIALLESAGYEFEDGGDYGKTLSANTPISFEYLTNTTSGHVQIAEAVQQDLAAIGIDMSVKQEEWNVFLSDRKAGNFGVARDGWLADFNDPINMLEMWTTESGNNNAQFGR